MLIAGSSFELERTKCAFVLGVGSSDVVVMTIKRALVGLRGKDITVYVVHRGITVVDTANKLTSYAQCMSCGQWCGEVGLRGVFAGVSIVVAVAALESCNHAFEVVKIVMAALYEWGVVELIGQCEETLFTVSEATLIVEVGRQIGVAHPLTGSLIVG